MLAEQVTAWSALAWSTVVVLYLVASWALVQVGWKMVQVYHERRSEAARVQEEEVRNVG